MSINTSEIAPRFNKKLSTAINSFAQHFSLPATDIRILISPVIDTEKKQTKLRYSVYNKGIKIGDAKFDEIVQLDMLERLVINEEKVTDYIINSIVKFSIGAVCDISVLDVMIFFNGLTIKLALLKEKKIINYFTVANLF